MHHRIHESKELNTVKKPVSIIPALAGFAAAQFCLEKLG